MTATLTGAATIYDWTVPAGELVQLRFPVLDRDGAPFSVTGWSVDAKIKTRAGGTVLHTWATGDIQTSGAFVTLTVLPATSLGWAFDRGWWRAKVIHPSDATQIYRVIQGRFIVDPD